MLLKWPPTYVLYSMQDKSYCLKLKKELITLRLSTNYYIILSNIPDSTMSRVCFLLTYLHVTGPGVGTPVAEQTSLLSDLTIPGTAILWGTWEKYFLVFQVSAEWMLVIWQLMEDR